MTVLSRQRRRFPRPVSEPPVPVDQDEQRRRRRASLRVVYSGEFDLLAEVSDIVEPLAQRVAAEPAPAAYWAEVDDLVAATHTAVLEVVNMVATCDAQRRTAHLPFDRRGHAVKLIVAARPRPARPNIAREALVDGSWAGGAG